MSSCNLSISLLGVTSLWHVSCPALSTSCWGHSICSTVFGPINIALALVCFARRCARLRCGLCIHISICRLLALKSSCPGSRQFLISPPVSSDLTRLGSGCCAMTALSGGGLVSMLSAPPCAMLLSTPDSTGVSRRPCSVLCIPGCCSILCRVLPVSIVLSIPSCCRCVCRLDLFVTSVGMGGSLSRLTVSCLCPVWCFPDTCLRLAGAGSSSRRICFCSWQLGATC